MRQYLPLPTAFGGNIAASGMATNKVPRNRRVHRIDLVYKTNAAQATIEADLTQIRLKVNSKVVRTFSATEANAIALLNGIPFTAGILPILLAEPKRRTPEGEEYLSWLMYEALAVGDFDIEVDIGGAAAAPTLIAKYEFDFEKPFDQVCDRIGAPGITPTAEQIIAAPRLRRVMHWNRKNVQCAAAFPSTGKLAPAEFFPVLDGHLHRVHAFDPVVTQMDLVDGAGNIIQSFDTVSLPARLQQYGMAKVANVMSCVVDFTTQLSDGLYMPAYRGLALQFVTSAAATGNQFSVIQEIRKNFDN